MLKLTCLLIGAGAVAGCDDHVTVDGKPANSNVTQSAVETALIETPESVTKSTVPTPRRTANGSPQDADGFIARGEHYLAQVHSGLNLRSSFLGFPLQDQDTAGILKAHLEYAAIADDSLQAQMLLMGEGGPSLSRAFADFREAARLKPLSARAHRGIGSAIVLVKDTRRALRSFDRCIELDPRDPEAYRVRGKAHQMISAELACVDFDAALKVDLEYAPAIRDRAFPLAALGNVDFAKSEISRAIKMNPTDARAFCFRYAVLCASKRTPSNDDLSAAVLDLTASIEILPNSSRMYVYRATINNGLREFQKGMNDADTAIRLDPSESTAYWLRANALIELGRLEEALRNVNEAIRLSPLHADPHATRQRIYTRLGEHAKADSDRKRAEWLKILNRRAWSVQRAAEDGDSWLALSEHLASGDDLATAEKAYTKTIQFTKDPAAAYAGRAAVRLKQGNAEASVADATNAIETAPSRGAYATRGDAWLQLGDADKAIADYQRAKRLDAAVAKAYLLRAESRKAAGKEQEADEALREALSIDPEVRRR